jgi:putative ABC transport system permease protein
MSGAITHQSGRVIVFAREAERSFGGSLVTAEQLAEVSGSPGVADAAELGVAYLSFRGPDVDERVNASVLGYRPGRPGSPTGLRTGRLPESPTEVVASAEDAAGRFTIGDTITVEPGDVALVVVGLTQGGRLNVGPTLWAPWPTYERLVQLAAPDMAVVLPSVVAVQPDDGVEPEQLARDLTARISALEALTREDASAKAPGRDAIQIAFLAVLALGYLVVAVVIGFFFLTMTLQKESSITLLRAVGAHGRYLVRSLLLQVAVVTFGGLAIGVVLLVAVAPMVRSTIVVTVEPADMMKSAVPALAVALLGAVPPLRRVLRTDPFAVVSRPSLGGVG